MPNQLKYPFKKHNSTIVTYEFLLPFVDIWMDVSVENLKMRMFCHYFHIKVNNELLPGEKFDCKRKFNFHPAAYPVIKYSKRKSPRVNCHYSWYYLWKTVARNLIITINVFKRAMNIYGTKNRLKLWNHPNVNDFKS